MDSWFYLLHCFSKLIGLKPNYSYIYIYIYIKVNRALKFYKDLIKHILERLMITNNSRSMADMFSTLYELICFFVQKNYYFAMYLLGLLIIDQLFLGSINTLDSTK